MYCCLCPVTVRSSVYSRFCTFILTKTILGKKPSIGTVVKGFNAKEIKISGYEDVTKIEEIRFYDYYQNAIKLKARSFIEI